MHKRVTTPATLNVTLLAFVALLAVLGLSTSASEAAINHPYTGTSLGPGGVGSGSFGNVQGVTVDQRNGDVLVYDDSEGGRVYKFDAAGASVDFSSTGTNAIEGVGGAGGDEEEIAVDSSSSPDAGDIYVANNSTVRIYAESGAFLGELSGGEMCGVAVDPSGNVYVGMYSQGAVRRYAPSTSPVTNADETGSLKGIGGICNVAADGAGNVYSANYSGGVYMYGALQFGSLSATGTLVDARGRTLAVDGTSDEVFIDESEQISQYDGSAEPPEFKGTSGEGGALSGSFGVAVDHESGKLYVGDQTQVKIFGPGVVVASASTEGVSEVASSSATLHGSVEPAGTEVTGCVFEYGSEAGNLDQTAPCEPAPPYTGTTPVAVSAHLTGLQGTAYHYRIVASNAGGGFHGAERLLETAAPPVILAAGAAHESQLAARFEIAVAPHGLDTHYDIEYGPTASYGSTTSSVDLGSEGEVIYDNPTVTGLSADATYHFRVVATNAEGTVATADQVFSTRPPASIAEEAAYHVGNSSVTISAQLEDYGTVSTFRVEYGTTASYGSTSGSTPLAGVERSVAATTVLGKLQPATNYHFRLVVENEAGTAHGPDVSFTTKPLTAPSHVLPDGRLYERVSPAANADGNVYQDAPGLLTDEGLATLLPFIASPDGNTLAYVGEASEHGGTGHQGNLTGNEYLARRLAGGGWGAENVTPASGEFNDTPEYQGFSPDLSVGFLTANGAQPLAAGAPGKGFGGLYAKTFSTGSYDPLVRSQPTNREAYNFEATYAGASADLSHMLFMANDALTPGAPSVGRRENDLYDSSGGATVLVNVLPDGSAEANATFGGPTQSEIEDPDGPMLAHDISEDGSRIFWTDLNTQDLYVRENDTAPQSPLAEGKCTVAADACTVLIAENARFWNATPDGSKVLYSQEGELYEYDLGDGQRVDLAPHGSVNGVLGASEDLSYVYFVAKAALAPGAEPVTCQEGEGAPESSHCNLYAVHLGEPIRFIGALHGLDNSGFPGSPYGRSDGDWQTSLGDTEAEATPDGTHLMFGSKAHLTGYESKDGEEIFLYDFPTGQLSCVSCSADGEAIEKPQPGFNVVISAYLPVTNVGTMLPHLMSDDGDRVFFDSATPLVSQDTNNKTDVYEWERDGTGSCTQSSGCIYLISDGTSGEGSFLIGASTSGDDVFFTTRDKMVAEDENENVDVYDARADAASPPAAPKCTGAGCQGVPAAPPVFATPPSVTYNGVGNFTPSVHVSVTKKVKSKALTRRDKLAKALKVCRKKTRRKRVACEKQARRKFATKSAGRGK